MQIDNTYKKNVDKFLSIENRHKLLYSKINNLYFWQISRVNIYLAIMDQATQGNNPVKIKKIDKVIDLFYRIFINSLFFNPFFDFTKKSILVFDSGRKYKVDEEYIDIYTDFLLRDFKRQEIGFTSYETNYKYDIPFFKRNIKTKHLDFIFLFSKVISIFKKYRFTQAELEIIENIEKELEKEYKKKIDIRTIILNDIRYYESNYPFFRLLFKIKKPKEIYLTNSCDKFFIVSAAKSRNIIVNELQHGLISNCDIINNFPGIMHDSLFYFPDRFYLWENVNMCYAELPVSEKNIVYFNNQNIENWLKKTKDVEKENNTILIISQPYGSLSIWEFLKSNLPDLKDYKIIYKLHPAEDKQLFYEIQSRIKNDNLCFVGNEESIYMLLKKASYVVGIFSSALFEAELFHCNIFLLNLPGVEMSLPLLKNKKVKLLDINEKLISFL